MLLRDYSEALSGARLAKELHDAGRADVLGLLHDEICWDHHSENLVATFDAVFERHEFSYDEDAHIETSTFWDGALDRLAGLLQRRRGAVWRGHPVAREAREAASSFLGRSMCSEARLLLRKGRPQRKRGGRRGERGDGAAAGGSRLGSRLVAMRSTDCTCDALEWQAYGLIAFDRWLRGKLAELEERRRRREARGHGRHRAEAAGGRERRRGDGNGRHKEHKGNIA